MIRGVDIVAMAARTAVGLTASASAAAARAGISRVARHPIMIDGSGEHLRCGRDTLLAPDRFGAERIAELAVDVLHAAAAIVVERGLVRGAVSVLLALPETRPGFDDSDAGYVVRALEARPPGVPIHVEAMSRGHAGALHALAIAVERIAAGQIELCIVGGADSYLHADTIDWLDRGRRVARADVRGGFIPGEAAAMLVVASRSARARLGLSSLARVSGVATAHERRTLAGPEGMLGEGLTSAVARAASGLRPPDQIVDEIFCDINGERHRTDDWGLTALRNVRLFRDPTGYRSGTSAWGDVGAASGALFCAWAAQAWQRGYAAGPRALVWACSDGGLRGAALLERPEV